MTDLRRRVAFVFLLTSVLLGVSPRLLNLLAIRPNLDASDGQSYVQRQVALCDGGCTCSYADRIINGQPYVHGERGFRLCSTSCGVDNCNFRPGVDGCGAILYLGCTDLDCRIDTSPVLTPVPIHPRVVIPPIVYPTSAPTPVSPAPSNCETPHEWVELQPPRIVQVFHLPPYPVLQSQVSARETVPQVTFSVEVRGGKALRKVRQQTTVCRNGGRYPADCPDTGVRRCRTLIQATYPDPVVRVEATLQLTGQSQSWINGYLASRYPRAHVRQPTSGLQWTGSAMARRIVLPSWDPRDPGHHTVQVVVTTAGTPISAPQTVSRVHRVDVSLRDTTLTP